MAQYPRKIAALIYPGTQILDATGPLEVFATASRLEAQRSGRAGNIYETELIARRVGPVEVTGGLKLIAERSWVDSDDTFDTLIVAGGIDVESGMTVELYAWLCRMSQRVRRLVSVCSGALILAAAGLLDGRRATTHWESCPKMAALFPRIDVDPDALFVRDGHIYTSAGITAGIDLALALVEEDHGRELALATARELVVYFKRPGGQSQFSAQLLAQMEGEGGLDELVEWIFANLHGDLSVEELAARAGMSPRNFARVFKRRVGTPPARFVEMARLDHARRRLEESEEPLKIVAVETGFGSVERMRRSFERHLNVAPSDYRRIH